MKKIIACTLLLSMLFGLTACGNGGSTDTKSDTQNETTQVVCDVTRFANITSAELVGLLGEPNEISETTPATGFVEIPCTYYDYYENEELGEVSFLLVNDRVAKFTAYHEFPFAKKDKLLASLNVKKADGCVMAVDSDTALRFRCVTDEIDDLWVTNIEGDKYGFLAVTYDMLYFEEWYLPMSVSEQSDYQYWTQEYVKSILKAPKSADFPNITKWAIVKNNFYVAAQSYVDAVNSFGAEIRSEFTFIYPAGSNTPIYAVFDGEKIVDNGYTPTADLVKQLVADMAKEAPAIDETPAMPTEQTTPAGSEVTQPTPAPEPIHTPTPETTPAPTPTPTPTPTPPSSEKTEPVQEKNNISDLEYVINNVCERYNSGDTSYSGQLYGTVNSATSITIEHYVRELVPESEEYKLYQMEDALVKTVSETLNSAFPEKIDVYVYTTATIIEDSAGTGSWNSEWISASDLESNFKLYVLWLDTEIAIMPEGIAVTSHYITADKAKLQSNGTCEGSYNGKSIHIKYDGSLYFYYDDLVSAGII